MANIFQVQAKDAVIAINNYRAVNAVQNFNWDPKFNEQNLQELGNVAYTATTLTPEIGGSFDRDATGSTVAMLRSMIMSSASGEFNGYQRGLPSAANPNLGTIRTTDLENAVFDLAELKAPNQTFSRATLLPRMYLTQLMMKSEANGKGSETFSFEGDIVRIFPTGKHDITAVPCKRVTGSSTNLQVLDPSYDDIGQTADTTEFVVYALLIDEQLVPASAITTTPGATGAFSIAAPYSAGLGARLSLIVYRRVPGAMPAIEYPTASRFVKGNQTDIFLVPSSVVDISQMSNGALMAYNFSADQRLLRAQSFDLTIDLRRDTLRQIAQTQTGNAVYYRAATYPLNMTSSISIMETTLDTYAKLQGKDASVDVLDAVGFEGQRIQVVKREYLNGTPLQTTAVLDARVSGNTHKIQVGGRAEQTINLSASQIVIEGV